MIDRLMNSFQYFEKAIKAALDKLEVCPSLAISQYENGAIEEAKRHHLLQAAKSFCSHATFRA